MFALLLSSIYPHYYGWWGFFNYLNEDFYSQWWHQVFFSITELISTVLVVHLSSRENRIEPWKLLVIMDINSMHILINCLDQFVNNVLLHGGQSFEVARDIGLLLPDVFHVFICYFELRILADSKKVRIWNLFYKEELMMSAVLVTLFSLLGRNLWRFCICSMYIGVYFDPINTIIKFTWNVLFRRSSPKLYYMCHN